MGSPTTLTYNHPIADMTPEPKRPLKVFLCHAHADRGAVRALHARLTSDGVDVWFDKEKLLPGHDWELEIRKAVREADAVVVCLSRQFNQDGFRQKEVRLALDIAMEKHEDTIFIIPARLEECDTLESLKKWHEVNLFEEDGYVMLLRALRTRADKIGEVSQVAKKNLLNLSIVIISVIITMLVGAMIWLSQFGGILSSPTATITMTTATKTSVATFTVLPPSKTLLPSSSPTTTSTFTLSPTMTYIVNSSPALIIKYCSWGVETGDSYLRYECACAGSSCACTVYAYQSKTIFKNNKQNYFYSDNESRAYACNNK